MKLDFNSVDTWILRTAGSGLLTCHYMASRWACDTVITITIIGPTSFHNHKFTPLHNTYSDTIFWTLVQLQNICLFQQNNATANTKNHFQDFCKYGELKHNTEFNALNKNMWTPPVMTNWNSCNCCPACSNLKWSMYTEMCSATKKKVSARFKNKYLHLTFWLNIFK